MNLLGGWVGWPAGSLSVSPAFCTVRLLACSLAGLLDSWACCLAGLPARVGLLARFPGCLDGSLAAFLACWLLAHWIAGWLDLLASCVDS
jgi:hypothetical protein